MELLESIVSRDNMRRAYERVVSNGGSAGVDGVEVADFRRQVDQQWSVVKAKLLEGSYEPQGVRSVEIPKPGGGTRKLGIPTLMDRMIQQAISQELIRLYDSSFSASSYGFRPGRHAHQAMVQARRYVNEGYSHVVDIDLASFFDRVNHDYLMNLLSQRIKDKGLLKLIHRYLRSGAMYEGVKTVNREGTPQGGPLSPILSNILLDKLDKELEKRGHRFIRYADDICVFVQSKRGAERVLAVTSQYIVKELKLVVNESKSAATRPWKSKLLGYSFYHKKGEKGLNISSSSIRKYKTKVRSITASSKPLAMSQRYIMLKNLNRGWYNYFRLTEARSVLEELDQWVMRRLRLCYWRQWPKPRTRIAMLKQYGIPAWQAYQWGNTRKGPWRVSHSAILTRTLTKSFLKREGYLTLKDLGTLPNVLF